MKDILDHFEFDEPEFPWDERDAAEVVGKYFSVTEAEIAAARLRSEGVPCFVANATAQAVLPPIFPASCGCTSGQWTQRGRGRFWRKPQLMQRMIS